MNCSIKPEASNSKKRKGNFYHGNSCSYLNEPEFKRAKKRRRQRERQDSFKCGLSLTGYEKAFNPEDVSKKILEASRRVSVLIAKQGAEETIGENLIKPAMKIIAEVLMTDPVKTIFDCIPLSKKPVLEGIVEMSDSIKEILLSDISQSSYYALQIDESTDVANFANLMAFVRYEKNQEICEDFLFSKPLSEHETGENIFDFLNDFMVKNRIDWNRCIGVSTDGAKSLAGIIRGLAARIHQVAPNVIFTHACIHRQALATLQMPAALHKVLDESVKIINFIKNCTSDVHLTSKIFEGMESRYMELLYRTNVRWLSQGKMLNKLFELRHEIAVLINDLYELKNCLCDWEWLCKLAYLADIFSVLNNFSQSLKTKRISVFHVQDKVNGILAKLNLWQKRVSNHDLVSFPTLHGFIKSSCCKIDGDLVRCIIEHLEGLKMCLKDYFPDLNKNIQWIRHPFNISLKSLPKGLLHNEEDELLELSSDLFMKSKYKGCSLASFWLQAKCPYPALTKRVMRFILHFSNSGLCEVAFSEFLEIKSKTRNRHVDVEPHLRLKLTNKEPHYKHMLG